MKICVVCSGNFDTNRLDIFQSAIYEQVSEIRKNIKHIDFFLIKGKGFLGYLKNRSKLQKFIKKGNYDFIHAHYGLSGLLVSISTLRPFIITFHGSDINNFFQMFLSIFPSLLSKKNIFVSKSLKKKFPLGFLKKNIVLPCGVNRECFYPISKNSARKNLNFKSHKKIILFSSKFNNQVKNISLARKAINQLEYDVLFIEIRDFSRKKVSLMLNAADVLVLTSFSEGSPQIIKEAMACNCPIVSVDVGDVRTQINNAYNCFVVERDPKIISEKLNFVLSNNLRSNGNDLINKYDLKIISQKLEKLYSSVV